MNYLFITDNPAIAAFVNQCGVGRILIDLEITGKVERQVHRDTLISGHSIDHIAPVKAAVDSAQILVRVNPLHDNSAREVDACIAEGADLLMLPMFRTAAELETFCKLVRNRVPVVPLVETDGAVRAIDRILEVDGVSEIYIGLNDLHLDRKLTFIFEPLADGTVDRLAEACRREGKPFGFGGIARTGEGQLPGELVLAEHVRLGSSRIILSRTFHRHASNLADLQSNVDFADELKKMGEWEMKFRKRTPQDTEVDQQRIRRRVSEIAQAMRTDTIRYRTLATAIRRHAILMTHHGRAAHIGTTMSMADLLAVLYGGVMRIDPKRPDWPERDRFILSKGHGCAGVYAALAATGFFPVSWLEEFYVDGGRLTGHLTHTGVPGVEVSTGSLGHGLSIATGMALAAKRDGASHRVFVMLSDGECDEGSTWEPALFAPHHKLDNLVVIVDYNKIQSLGHVKEVLDLEPLGKKWEAFGWAVKEIDGHDLALIDKTLRAVPFESGKPSCIIAHTVKGKGVSFMEDKLLWHYRNASEDELKQALVELDTAK